MTYSWVKTLPSVEGEKHNEESPHQHKAPSEAPAKTFHEGSSGLVRTGLKTAEPI